MRDFLHALLDNQTLDLLLLGLLLLALLDWLSGTIAARRDGTFTTAHLADWINTHLLTVVVIALIALGAATLDYLNGTFSGASDLERGAITATTLAAWTTVFTAFGTYLVTTFSSLRININQSIAGKTE